MRNALNQDIIQQAEWRLLLIFIAVVEPSRIDILSRRHALLNRDSSTRGKLAQDNPMTVSCISKFTRQNGQRYLRLTYGDTNTIVRNTTTKVPRAAFWATRRMTFKRSVQPSATNVGCFKKRKMILWIIEGIIIRRIVPWHHGAHSRKDSVLHREREPDGRATFEEKP